MASDNINEVGKYIKNTRRKADYALKRYKPDVPRIERVRDIFDPNNSFSMSFDIKPGEDQALLDLTFNKPPPLGECNSDCLQSACEQFLVEAGNHFLTLSRPYNPTSIRVFDNNVAVDQVDIDETDPGAGQFFVQGLEGLGIVVVCYMYSDPGCDFPDVLGPNCPPTHSNLYTGLTAAFTDRFDRSQIDSSLPVGEPRQTSGGCGYWTGQVSGSGGTAFLNNAVAHLGGDRIASDQWEVLIAAEISSTTYSFTIGNATDDNASGLGASVVYTNNFFTHNQLIITFPYKLFQQDGFYTNNETFSFFTYSKYATFTKFDEWLAEDDAPILFFLRFAQVVPGGWYFKVWRASEEEPVDWDMQATQFDIRNDANNSVPPYTHLESAYGTLWTMGITMPAVNGVTIWTNPGNGQANPAPIDGYSLAVCRPYPNDGFTRFGFCPSYTVTSTEGGSGPSYAVWFSWPSFVDGPGLVESVAQTTSAQKYTGRPIGVTVKGQFSVTSYLGPTRTFGVQFISLGPGTPAVVGESYFGNIIGGGTAGGYNDTSLIWQDFEIHLPVNVDDNGDYVSQWTVGIVDNIDALAATLPRYEPPFLFANNTPIGINVRNLTYQPDGVLDCTTGNICPDNADNFDKRCGPLNNGGVLLPAFCASLAESTNIEKSEVVFDGDNRQVWISRSQGVDVSTNLGETTVLYRAAGMTTDGSDGRCRRQSLATRDDVTTASHVDEVWMKYSSPFDCGDSEAYLELFWSAIDAPWFSPSTATTQTPFHEMFLGGQDGGPLMEFTQTQSGNTLEFISTEDFGTYPLPFSTNTWVSIRMRVEDERFQVKFWPAGTPEPGAWTYDLGASGDTPLVSWGFFTDAEDFDGDNTFFKYRNLTIASVDTGGADSDGNPSPNPV